MRRDAGEHPGQGEGKGLGTLRVSGARAGLLGQARPPPTPRAASALLGTSGVHMHAPRHVHPPAQMHTRTHTWPPDPEVPATQRSPGQHWPCLCLAPLPRKCPAQAARGCAGAQEVQRWARDRLVSGLKEGRELGRLPAQQPEAGEAAREAGLAERGGSEDSGGAARTASVS